MKRFISTCLAFTASVVLATAGTVDAKRIVSVGGTATETIFALGAGDRVVGVDVSSTFPEAATKLPQCGYMRTIAAEGIVSLKPDLVILAAGSGPQTAIEQLEKLEVPLVRLNEGYTLESVKERIKQLGATLGREKEAEELSKKIDARIADVKTSEKKPRVLFVLSRGSGSPLIAGQGTAADAMIALAGGENAGAEVQGYKPISGEALTTLAPDVILTTTRTFAGFGEGGLEKALPGVGLTPAGKANRVIVMDDLYLLGFGPRTADAVVELAERIQVPVSQAQVPQGSAAPAAQ